MIDEHLTRELLRAIHKGWRNPGDLAAIAMAHLFELCPRCRREFEAWRSDLGEDVAAPEGQDYDAVLDRIRAPAAANDGDVAVFEAQVEAERIRAWSRAEELLALPSEHRLEWVRREKGRHSGILLAEVLIEESRRRTPGYPHEGFALANLARLVLQHAPTSALAVEVYARALAYLANAARVVGDLQRADQILSDARYLLRSQGGGDRQTMGEIYGLEASLRIVQDREGDAIPLLLRAVLISRLEGPKTDLAPRCLVKLTAAHGRLGEVDRAVEIWNELRRTVRTEVAEELDCLARQNIASAFLDVGRPQDAQSILDEGKSGYSRFSPLRRARVSMLNSRVLYALGKCDEGEEQLVAVQSDFVSRGLRHDEAVVSLQLAEWYVEQRRRREAEPLVHEALKICRSLQVPRKLAKAEALNARMAG